ncbi:ABC-type metal ion transport system, periplasmic component/surface adhesin [Hylemonella gracilis ATCC 19624]|uniref:ABC-type metal ion transport system, periplasmic component/surface adhesin n=2 Tax=Hylemonella gracilis TaxID=80880 RepID=F3KWJ5_9BURK|nr:ABC-type metal ion transport system, periplasmic component/surface adhesin [Hylemonella gracilis ATCC 19624]
MSLDVAVDAQTLTLAIESPLDGFLGFERAPRTDAERKRVSDMVARLNAAQQLFVPDPAAECTLSSVTMSSAVLGLGEPKKEEDHPQGHGHDDTKRADGKKGHADDDHADIDVDIVFNCAKASQARFIDVKLFDAFKRIRAIDAQVATPQGQFKRNLRPDAARLNLVR